LWGKESSAIGIIVVGEQPDIVEDMSALTGRRKFEKYVFLVL